MELSRREFFGALTGLAAIVQNSSASAFDYNERGYNHLIPKYGDENFFESTPILGGIKGVPQYALRFKTGDGKIITETYVGTSKYAVSISTRNASTSMTLVDDKGDGVFRKKIPINEMFYPPSWVYKKYGGKDK